MKNLILAFLLVFAGSTATMLEAASCSASAGDPTCNASCSTTGATTSCSSGSNFAKCLAYDANGTLIDRYHCGCSGPLKWCVTPI
jgi:hypothetical protein